MEGYGDGADVVCRLGAFIKHVKWEEAYEETSDEESDNDINDYDNEDEYEVQLEDLLDLGYWRILVWLDAVFNVHVHVLYDHLRIPSKE